MTPFTEKKILRNTQSHRLQDVTLTINLLPYQLQITKSLSLTMISHTQKNNTNQIAISLPLKYAYK